MDEKKERVLHTRVSTSLDDELKERANQLGVSVSNLVRNVLQNAFEMVEEIVSDSGRVARAAGGREAGSKVAAAAADLKPIGWRELVLNVNALCSNCNAILPRGEKAAMAVFRGSGPDMFLCPACLGTLANDDNDRKDKAQS